jgi:hypothetical protein
LQNKQGKIEKKTFFLIFHPKKMAPYFFSLRIINNNKLKKKHIGISRDQEVWNRFAPLPPSNL